MSVVEPALIEIARPFFLQSCIAKLLEPSDSCRETLRSRLIDGTYGRPFVLEQDGVRSLYFNLRFIQSSMRLDDPDALDLPYTRRMMAFLLFNARPRRVLLLGLGGGSLAKFCYRRLPGVEIKAVELDPDVIAFRDEFRVPRDDERFAVVQGDGAQYVAQCAQRADVILVDAFDDAGVAPSLTRADFFLDAYRCLSGNGIVVMNIAGDKAEYASHVDQLREVFAGRLLAMPVGEDGNFVVFAFKNPQFQPQWKAVKIRARELEQRLGLEFSFFAQQLECGEKRRLVR